MCRWCQRSVLVFGVLLLAFLGVRASAADESAKPRLVVLVYFDQFRGDYFLRWHDLFTDGGFRRLEREGTWFTNCHYPYASTFTGPGHASIATGCSPDRHGIVMNDWYDRAAATLVYCATTERYQTVRSFPLTEAEQKAAKKEKGGGSPDRMLVPNFADALKEATGGRAKVVAVSMKDRSAVLPGGRRADACYWFDDVTGTFCTSTFYRDRPHAWVTEYNRSRPADRWFARDWTRLRTDLDYAKYSGPDDAVGEGSGVVRKQGRVFPHPMSAGLKQPGKDYFDTVVTSPFGNEVLLDFALHALDAEGLGHDDTPDLLSVSFSSNDYVGHQYGPDSQEVLDVTLRSDLIVRDLLDALDQRVGKGRYALVLSADHGVCPVPEVAAAHGTDAHRLQPVTFLAEAAAHLSKVFGAPEGKATWIERLEFPWVYLSYKTLAARGLSQEKVIDALVEYLRRQEPVQAVYTRQQLDAGVRSDDVIGRRVLKSYYPARCGDLVIITKPYWLPTTYATGTTHGSPHAYDTHVPLVAFGPGWPTGRSDEPVTPQAAAAVLAWAAGVAPPAGIDAPVPARLLRK